jgi:hypothetical protein
MWTDVFSFRSQLKWARGSAALIEFVPDDHLRIAIYDAMRGVKLATLKRSLTEDERHEMAAAIFTKYKRCGWRVLCYIDGMSAHTTFMPSKTQP